MREFPRIACIMVAASVLGMAGNALSQRPIPLLSGEGPGAWPRPADRMGAAALRASLEEGRPILIVDVRTPASFAADHHPEAINLPAGRFLESYAQPGMASLLKAAEEIVVVCENRECPSGDRVAEVLKGLGYGNVRVLDDGWRGYRTAAASPQVR